MAIQLGGSPTDAIASNTGGPTHSPESQTQSEAESQGEQQTRPLGGDGRVRHAEDRQGQTKVDGQRIDQTGDKKSRQKSGSQKTDGEKTGEKTGRQKTGRHTGRESCQTPGVTPQKSRQTEIASGARRDSAAFCHGGEHLGTPAANESDRESFATRNQTVFAEEDRRVGPAT